MPISLFLVVAYMAVNNLQMAAKPSERPEHRLVVPSLQYKRSFQAFNKIYLKSSSCTQVTQLEYILLLTAFFIIIIV